MGVAETRICQGAFVNDCPFCEVAGSEDAVLDAGAHSVAFLDINPIRAGHVLIVPKEHEPEFFDLPDLVISDVMRLAKRIAKAQRVAFRPTRVGMLVAGLDIPHAHLHLIPMHDYHDITSKRMIEGKISRASEAELEKSKHRLRKSLPSVV